MTSMYRTEGRLTNPVTDFNAAQAYLTQDDMTQYFGIWDDTVHLKDIVSNIRWALTSTNTWKVTVVTTRPLTEDESTRLSEWISGQNSDGLGEGFEQQAFAEVEPELDGWGDQLDPEADWAMASFDWETNPCKLERVK